VQNERINIRAKLRNDELHAVGHQPGDEMNVARQAVQLGHCNGALSTARFCERSGKLGPAV
jgi:hypothetical protein